MSYICLIVILFFSSSLYVVFFFFFFFQAEDGIRDTSVTGVQTCALPISVDVFRMNVENPLGRGGHVGQIAGDAVLRALGLTRGAARVHQEQWRFPR